MPLTSLKTSDRLLEGFSFEAVFIIFPFLSLTGAAAGPVNNSPRKQDEVRI
jgi:hypothetical protein